MPDAWVGDELGGGEAADRDAEEVQAREWIGFARQHQDRATDPRPVRGSLVPRLAPPRGVERVRQEHEPRYRPLSGEERRDSAAERVATDDHPPRSLVKGGAVNGQRALSLAAWQRHNSGLDSAPFQPGEMRLEPFDAARSTRRQEESGIAHALRVRRAPSGWAQAVVTRASSVRRRL